MIFHKLMKKSNNKSSLLHYWVVVKTTLNFNRDKCVVRTEEKKFKLILLKRILHCWSQEEVGRKCDDPTKYFINI
jgi:hypothetical protein